MKMDMFHGYVNLPEGIYVSSSECTGFHITHLAVAHNSRCARIFGRQHDDVIGEMFKLKHWNMYFNGLV